MGTTLLTYYLHGNDIRSCDAKRIYLIKDQDVRNTIRVYRSEIDSYFYSQSALKHTVQAHLTMDGLETRV